MTAGDELNRRIGWARRAGRLRRGMRRNGRVMVGLFILAAALVAALFAPFLAPHDPYEQDLSQAHRPPAWLEGGLPEHLLGTDYIGRDVLSRVIYGSRVSLLVCTGGVLIASLLGITFGMLAGYLGGRIDAVITRIVDVVLSVPYILFVVFIASMVGPSLVNVILIFGVTDFALFTRAVRGDVLVLRESQFVEAAQSIGAGRWRILVRHLLPNIIGIVITIATFEMAAMVLWEAGLGFLGLSVPPIIPSWGNMMAEGRGYLRTSWWLATFPGLAVMLLSLGINLTGDWVRFTLDPRSRGRE